MPTLLIAEDNERIAEFLAELLSDRGYTVRCVPDGVAALELLAEQPCDIVLADLSMPRCDGRQLRASLAADPRYQQLPVILMTTNDRVTAQDHEDFSAILLKPFHLPALLNLLDHYAPLQSPDGRSLEGERSD